jgi:hypothetical protein
MKYAAQMAEETRVEPLRMALHLLPTDALGHILHRLSTPDLHRIARLPSRTLATAAAADSLWLPRIATDFGAAMAALAAEAAASPTGVADSAEVVQSMGASEFWATLNSGRLAEILGDPEQLLDLAVQRSCPRLLRRAFETYCDPWRRQSSLRAAHYILELLVPRCFASDPDRWVAGLTRGEGTEEEQARVLARFAHHNGRAWAESRERGSEDTELRERCCLVLSHYMTTHKSCAGASLAMAACRAYVGSFDLAEKRLVPALRIFLEFTKPPKEQQRLCRLLWAFAGAYYDQQVHQKKGIYITYIITSNLFTFH